MTKSTRDIPTHEGMTVADRLKAARQGADKTRKALSEGTGIPASTLEKYERGDMDPNTSRLQTICDYLGVSVNWILNGDDIPSVAVTEKTAETQPSANVAETSTEMHSEDAVESINPTSPANENDPIEHIREMLEDLDNMRANEFEGVQRGAMALVESVHAELKYMEPNDLLTLALERDLHEEEDCLDAAGILVMFSEDLEEGKSYCGNIEDRILDTAILGVDLFSIERGPLVDIANGLQEEHDIDSPNFFSWGKSSDFIPLIRPHLRTLAIYGNGYGFGNLEEFPKRENLADKEVKKDNKVSFFPL